MDEDRAVIATIQDLRESLNEEIPIRLDGETLTKTLLPGNRCRLEYEYDNGDPADPLYIKSLAFVFKTRHESYEQFRELSEQWREKFQQRLPEATYRVRDDELPIDDQSRFGSFMVDDRPVAYFFAQRRGANVYIGFFQASNYNDGAAGEIFAGPIDNLGDWEPGR